MRRLYVVLCAVLLIPSYALALGNDSQCISNTIPTNMYAGESRSVSITFKNIGTNTWTNRNGQTTGDYDFAIPNPSSPSATPTGVFALPSDVAPGQSVTVNFVLTAPSVVGTYPTFYKMLEEQVGWFGETCGQSIQVVTPPPQDLVSNAQCIGSTIPSSMYTGETRNVSLTFKNTGTKTWTNNDGQPTGDFDVAQPSPSSPAMTPGGIMSLPKTVAPNETVTIPFSLTAPTASGSYSAMYRMLEEHVGWFGETCGAQAVQVTAPSFPDAVVATPAASGGATITWSGDATPGWTPYTIPIDAKITRITASMANIHKGEFFDFCSNVWRSGGPVPYSAFTGGFSELVCWNGYYRATDGDWTTTHDLSATPIYIAAGTQIICRGHTTGSTAQQRTTRRSCSITYEPYRAGEARYRIFRIPYIDQAITATAPFADSYYVASDTSHPLHVKGAFPYVAFDSTGQASVLACVRHLRNGGAIVTQDCLPIQTGSPSTNYVTPGFMSFDWMLPYPDLLDAACAATNFTNAGCAFFVLAEIPSALASIGPENMFTDYKNIPRPFLESWCSARPGISNCTSWFPLSSCVSTNSCWAANAAPAQTNPPSTSVNTQPPAPSASASPATPQPSASGGGSSAAASATGAAGANAGVAASGQSTSTALSSTAERVAALLVQIQQLQAQIAKLKGGSASAGPAQASYTGACPVLSRALSRGSRGDDVVALQTFLSERYKDFPADNITGYFGALTEAALQRWQKEQNIVSSGTPATTGWGTVGPKTRALLAQCH